MEECPYCKKPFKRLKSHLPHCKVIKLTIPADQDVCQSEQATFPHAKKKKSPIKDLTKANERELGTKSEKRNRTLMRDRTEQTAEPILLPAIGLERAGDTKASDDDTKNQIQLSLKMVKNPEPKISLKEDAKAQFHAVKNTTPKRELARDLPQPGESRSYPPQTKASVPFGPVEPSLSNQDRKYSSALLNDAQATSKSNLDTKYSSALLNDAQATSTKSYLDTTDPSKEKFVVKLLDLPTGDNHSSPMNLSYGGKRERTGYSCDERDSRAEDHLSEMYIDVLRDTEKGKKNMESQILNFQVSTLDQVQVKENPGKELDLGVEACGSKGHTKESVSVTEMQECPPRSDSSKSLSMDAPTTEKKSRGEGPSLDLFMPTQKICNEFLSVSEPRNQSLTSLAIKFLQEEKAEAFGPNRVPDGKALMGSEGQAFLEPKSGCGPQALLPECQRPLPSSQHCTPKTLFPGQMAIAGQMEIANRKTLPSSLGLEWFPELYPGYLGLGVLPGKPQHWNSMAQKPQLISPQGERVSQVPLLERSSAALWSWEPPARLTTSSVALKRLLGAVHKGWIKCSTTMKSGVGGATMLFTGYFLLCYSLSFKQLKLGWRKQR